MAWFNGKPVAFTTENHDQRARVLTVDLPVGSSRLLIRLTRNGRAEGHSRLVTTFSSDQPVGFGPGMAARAQGNRAGDDESYRAYLLPESRLPSRVSTRRQRLRA